MKVPLLFLLTLVVTFPPLYVFSALARSRLRFLDTLRLLLVGVTVNVALLASFGPVTGFFTLSTESYPFMIVLNVLFFVVSGTAGLVFMYKAVAAVFDVEDEKAFPVEADVTTNSDPTTGEETEDPKDKPESASVEKGEAPAEGKSEKSAPESPAKLIFCVWTIIYGVVGAQMGWILRPFIGAPTKEFEWFRDRQSHFFEAFVKTLKDLFQ